MALYQQPTHLLKALSEREQNGQLRRLKSGFPVTDFCSNDYLGFSKLGLLAAKVHASPRHNELALGSGGSRLTRGNSKLMDEAEKQIALFHHAPAALLFNSGYDANLGLLACVPQKNDLILYDELVHPSLFDGIRLSQTTHYKFAHNDAHNLEELIHRHHKNYENIFVVVESVYSMDGDTAPLLELVEICNATKNIFLIVDEAHAIGVFGNQGRGLCNALGVEKRCFARIYTYGKALGCHGASVVGSEILKNYLVNFSRTFIYTTALPDYSVNAILNAYQCLIETEQKDLLHSQIAYFYSQTKHLTNLIKSQSAIHTLLIGSAQQTDKLLNDLSDHDFHVRAYKYPAVKEGRERIRISLHAFNSKQEMDALLERILAFKF